MILISELGAIFPSSRMGKEGKYDLKLAEPPFAGQDREDILIIDSESKSPPPLCITRLAGVVTLTSM